MCYQPTYVNFNIMHADDDTIHSADVVFFCEYRINFWIFCKCYRRSNFLSIITMKCVHFLLIIPYFLVIVSISFGDDTIRCSNIVTCSNIDYCWCQMDLKSEGGCGWKPGKFFQISIM